MNIKKLAVIAAAGLWMAGSAQAAVQLLSFSPIPISQTVPEFTWTGPGGNFVDSAGSHNALTIAATLPVTVTSPTAADETSDSSGNSSFANATMTLSSSTDPSAFSDAGAYSYGSATFQTLSTGTFSMTAADGESLLAGTFVESQIDIFGSTSSPDLVDVTVNYSSGAIYNALRSAGYAATGGSGTIALQTVNGDPVQVTQGAPIGGGEYMATVAAFAANASGTFDVVPEPASLGLIGLAAIFASRRRRV